MIKLKEITIGSWNYFVGHHPQKGNAPQLAGTTRL